jgi:nicotinamidase-related amidase
MPAPVVIALHYQNDVLHPDGRIRVGLADDDTARAALVCAAGQLLSGARARQWPIVHIRIAFRPDYADLARNTPIFRNTEKLGACKDGDWGTEYFSELAPAQGPREFALTHTRISGFYGTQLEQLLQLLKPARLIIAGVATHSCVESTVRDAADRGFAVEVAADACAAADRAVHQASLASMSLIARIATVQEILADEETSP